MEVLISTSPNHPLTMEITVCRPSDCATCVSQQTQRTSPRSQLLSPCHHSRGKRMSGTEIWYLCCFRSMTMRSSTRRILSNYKLFQDNLSSKSAFIYIKSCFANFIFSLSSPLLFHTDTDESITLPIDTYTILYLAWFKTLIAVLWMWWMLQFCSVCRTWIANLRQVEEFYGAVNGNALTAVLENA